MMGRCVGPRDRPTIRAAAIWATAWLVTVLWLGATPGWAQDEDAPVESPPTEQPLTAQGNGALASVPATLDPLSGMRQEHRSATAAILMSVPFPGWGQMYAEEPFWGLVSWGVETFFYSNILINAVRSRRSSAARDALDPSDPAYSRFDSWAEESHKRAIDFVWWAAGGLLIISLDAYVSVHLVDFDDPGAPTPDLDREWESLGLNGGGQGLALQFPF